MNSVLPSEEGAIPVETSGKIDKENSKHKAIIFDSRFIPSPTLNMEVTDT